MVTDWMGGRFDFWRFNAVVWIFLGIFTFVIRLLLHHPPVQALILTLVQEPLGFLLSATLYYFFRHFSVGDPFTIKSALWVVILSLFATGIHTMVAHSFADYTGWHYPNWTPREQWLLRLTFYWLIYMVWSLALFSLGSKLSAEAARERTQAVMEEKQRMELQLLRAQLEPHFLFNALNSVAAEIQPHPRTALQIVRELSDYLRYSLDHRDRLLAPLSEELDAIRAYLKVEEVRFGDRVQADLNATPQARQRIVPSFLLQPLVENAVKHGLHQTAGPWTLLVRAEIQGDTLRIEVGNDGRLAADSRERPGVGLDTLARRLALHYPGRYQFSLTQTEGRVLAQLALSGSPCCD